MTLIPGFNDAHLHFLALASSLTAVDCSLRAVRSIADIQQAIQARVAQTAPGQWVRAHGYDETDLAERGHPTRADLDAVAPDHPVRLDHRSSHACVLNTRALQQVDITASTADPPDGVIERDGRREPTGLLLEMNAYVSQRMDPQPEDSLEGVVAANYLLLSLGITSFQDASPTNSVERFNAFHRLKLERRLGPRVTVMPGIQYLPDFLAQGLHYGSSGLDIHLGPAKIMLTATTGTLQPSRPELDRQVMEAQRQGYPVAIHAVEAEAVAMAAEVLAEVAQSRGRSRRLRHRIEHASECPPKVFQKLQNAGAVVVTQPGFIYCSGQRYLREVPAAMQSYLYRIGGWVRAGVAVAFSSDAPVAPPDPLKGIYAAVTRRSEGRSTVAPAEGVDAEAALRLYTQGAAYAAGEEGIKGTIEPGKLADLVLLDQDPTAVEPEALLETCVRLTVVGGEVLWEG